jgi:hypothetical protein
MVKTGAERASKYGVKYDAEVVGKRFTATTELAKTKQVELQEALAAKAEAVRNKLDELGIPAILSGFFHSFSNCLFGIVRKYGISAVAQSEAERAAAYWASVSLDAATVKNALNEIMKIYGLSPTIS